MGEVRKASRELDDVATGARHALYHDAPIKDQPHPGRLQPLAGVAACHLWPSARSATLRIVAPATPVRVTVTIRPRAEGLVIAVGCKARRMANVSPAAATVRITRRDICFVSIDSKRREA